MHEQFLFRTEDSYQIAYLRRKVTDSNSLTITKDWVHAVPDYLDGEKLGARKVLTFARLGKHFEQRRSTKRGGRERPFWVRLFH